MRIRVVLGYLNIKYQSTVLPYNDEATPIRLTGKKELPIFEFDDGSILGESLDIISKLDSKLQLPAKTNIEDLLKRIGADVHNLAMPFWIWTDEFDEESRAYFQKKKEIKRGPFSKLVDNQSIYLEGLNKTLLEIEKELKPFYKSTVMTLDDVLIVSHLNGMYVVPGFTFTCTFQNYMQSIIPYP